MYMKNLTTNAEIGKNFLNANNDKYTLRFADTDKLGYQAIELCRKDKNGEFQRLMILDTRPLYCQITPAKIAASISYNIQTDIQAEDYALHNHKHESAEKALGECYEAITNCVMKKTNLIRDILTDAENQPEETYFDGVPF